MSNGIYKEQRNSTLCFVYVGNPHFCDFFFSYEHVFKSKYCSLCFQHYKLMFSMITSRMRTLTKRIKELTIINCVVCSLSCRNKQQKKSQKPLKEIRTKMFIPPEKWLEFLKFQTLNRCKN